MDHNIESLPGESQREDFSQATCRASDEGKGCHMGIVNGKSRCRHGDAGKHVPMWLLVYLCTPHATQNVLKEVTPMARCDTYGVY
jgi:hypothetical protein